MLHLKFLEFSERRQKKFKRKRGKEWRKVEEIWREGKRDREAKRLILWEEAGNLRISLERSFLPVTEQILYLL